MVLIWKGLSQKRACPKHLPGPVVKRERLREKETERDMYACVYILDIPGYVCICVS